MMKAAAPGGWGVWVRDSTAGVGTLTYYDPATGAYGALGHAITDSDTGSLLPVREGALMQAEIVDVRRGQRGAPGELRGSFLREQVTLGTVQVNTALGIYGQLEGARRKRAVSRGPAHGLPRTGAHGRSHDSIHHRRAGSLRIRHRDHPGIPSECRRAQIHGAARNRRAAAVFHRRIVQGMSGSPILQNGRIVGAVTHVLLNDPTQGYGILMENMLAMAGNRGGGRHAVSAHQGHHPRTA